MTKYTLAFLFDDTLRRVALIQKQRPMWQQGKLNGIGGKVRPSEGNKVHVSLSREFKEEAGVKVEPHEWFPFGLMAGKDWQVTCFVMGSTPLIDQVKTMTDENIFVVDSNTFDGMPVIGNLRWLVPMAKDYLTGGRSFHNFIEYK